MARNERNSMGHTSNRNHQRENAKGKRTQQRGTKKLVGAVGIELKAALKILRLFIPLDDKNAKNTAFAQPRYTRGTCGYGRILKSRGLSTDASARHVSQVVPLPIFECELGTLAHHPKAPEFALPSGEPVPGAPVVSRRFACLELRQSSSTNDFVSRSTSSIGNRIIPRKCRPMAFVPASSLSEIRNRSGIAAVE